jgi:hypothetical protein
MMLKSNRCTSTLIVDRENLPVCFSLIIMRWDHPTASSLTPTSSTSVFRTNSTSSRPVWTASSASASPISLTAWSLSYKNSELSTGLPSGYQRIPGFKDWNATIRVPTLMIVWLKEWNSIGVSSWLPAIRIWKGGSGKYPVCLLCI